MILTFIQGHRCTRIKKKKKKICIYFLGNFAIDLDEIGKLPQLVGLMKLMLNLFCSNAIQVSELCRHDFTKYTLTSSCDGALVTHLFQTWYDAKHC